jgi:hypothetical protein
LVVEGGGTLGAGRIVFQVARLLDVVLRDATVRFGLLRSIGSGGAPGLCFLGMTRDLAAHARPVLLALTPPRTHARLEHEEHHAQEDQSGNHDQYHCKC